MSESTNERLAALLGADAIDKLAYASDEWGLVRDAEQTIERRQLQGEYIAELRRVVCPYNDCSEAGIQWAILTATSGQRCEAALQVLS